MVSNFTKINKTNIHLSPKESLNSDGQQFHEYQLNERSPLTLTHWIKKQITPLYLWSSNYKEGVLDHINR
jgi:hypothetical protein